MNIAVLPARGGSKRIPRKNIKDFCGKPMIVWSIEAAKASELFDHIIVSTDDPEIAEISIQHGAEVPFVRPAELADDFTGTNKVIAHATQWAIENGWSISSVCCIYPAAPFIQVSDLKKGLEELEKGSWDYVFPATDFSASIFKSLRQLENGGIEMFFPENFTKRNQDLPMALEDAAQFYWGRKNAWLEGNKFFDGKTFAIKIPSWRVQDIDTPDDWTRAEIINKAILKKGI